MKQEQNENTLEENMEAYRRAAVDAVRNNNHAYGVCADILVDEVLERLFSKMLASTAHERIAFSAYFPKYED